MQSMNQSAPLQRNQNAEWPLAKTARQNMNNLRWAWMVGGLTGLWIATYGSAEVPGVILPGGAKKPAAAAQVNPAKAPQTPGGAGGPATDEETETSERVQLPRDRLVERKLAEARRFIDDKDWPQAV